MKFDAAKAAPAHAAADKAARFEVHSVLRQANYDLTKHQFNTVASAAMKILNAIEKLPGRTPAAQEGLSILLRLLSPITPHVCHHLWRALGFGEDVMHAAWPEPDPAALEQDEIEYVVQVNGKKKRMLLAPNGLDPQGVEAFARASELVSAQLGGNLIKRISSFPGG